MWPCRLCPCVFLGWNLSAVPTEPEYKVHGPGGVSSPVAAQRACPGLAAAPGRAPAGLWPWRLWRSLADLSSGEWHMQTLRAVPQLTSALLCSLWVFPLTPDRVTDTQCLVCDPGGVVEVWSCACRGLGAGGEETACTFCSSWWCEDWGWSWGSLRGLPELDGGAGVDPGLPFLTLHFFSSCCCLSGLVSSHTPLGKTAAGRYLWKVLLLMQGRVVSGCPWEAALEGAAGGPPGVLPAWRSSGCDRGTPCQPTGRPH